MGVREARPPGSSGLEVDDDRERGRPCPGIVARSEGGRIADPGRSGAGPLHGAGLDDDKGALGNVQPPRAIDGDRPPGIGRGRSAGDRRSGRAIGDGLDGREGEGPIDRIGGRQ